MSCYIPRCIPSKKYLIRKSPPFSATNCHVGAIEKGNDNNLYQVVLRKGAGGLTQKWAKCFTKGTISRTQLNKRKFFWFTKIYPIGNYPYQYYLTK